MAYMIIDKAALVSDLKASVVEIIFDKIDTGERRIMLATLQGGFLPEKYRSHDAVNEQVAEIATVEKMALPVWDLNANDWRSIRLDRIISAQITNR